MECCDKMEGVEIVIRPKHIERFVFSLVILALAVLLIIKWGGGSCDAADNDTTGAMLTEAGVEEDNQSINASSAQDLCANALKDQDETDVDCGGSICDPCAQFKFCNVDSDCESDWCKGSVKCINPTCDDGEKNQDESNVDCGGTCGGFFYDGECHDEPMPSYSGRVELTIIKVETSINEYEGNENARIDSIKFKVENGKPDDIILTAYFYAYDYKGINIFGVDPYSEKERELTGSVDVPLLAPGEDYTETVIINEGKGRTLIETDPSDEYEIVVEIRDGDDKLIQTKTWKNT